MLKMYFEESAWVESSITNCAALNPCHRNNGNLQNVLKPIQK